MRGVSGMEASLFSIHGKIYSATKEGKEEDICILIRQYNGCFSFIFIV